MGRGDKKSRRGKIAIGSFGVSRKKKALKARSRKVLSPKAEAPVPAAAPAPEVTKPKRTVRKKTEA